MQKVLNGFMVPQSLAPHLLLYVHSLSLEPVVPSGSNEVGGGIYLWQAQSLSLGSRQYLHDPIIEFQAPRGAPTLSWVLFRENI